MNTIKNFDASRLQQEEAFGFHELVKAETAKCEDSKVTPLQQSYETAFAAFDAAFKPGGKSDLTVSIAEADALRDRLFRGLCQ